jgi:hypothetical protein
MRLLNMTCPACGASIENISGRVAICEYCESRYALEEEEAGAFAGIDDEADDSDFDGESSSLSMADYAAKVCADFIEEVGEGGSFRDTNKIRRGLEIRDGEDVYLIHDDTLLKSGKDGFAITDCGLHCRDMAEAPIFVAWESFAKADSPRQDGSHILSGKKLICYFTDDANLMPDLLSIYKKLHKHAKRCF